MSSTINPSYVGQRWWIDISWVLWVSRNKENDTDDSSRIVSKRLGVMTGGVSCTTVFKAEREGDKLEVFIFDVTVEDAEGGDAVEDKVALKWNKHRPDKMWSSLKFKPDKEGKLTSKVYKKWAGELRIHTACL